MYRAVIVFLLLACASASAADSTTASHLDVTPKSPIPTGTVATWPMDAAVPPGWLACNGQAVPASYPELRALMAAVPNYNARQFLRGASAGAGLTYQDSTREHYHGQPQHSHAVGTNLTSTAISGNAAAQTFMDRHTGLSGGWEPNKWPTSSYLNTFVAYVSGKDVSYSTQNIYGFGDQTVHETNGPSVVNGQVNNGYSSGTAFAAGGENTYINSNSDGSTGGTETAPQHTLVKYIIKAD